MRHYLFAEVQKKDYKRYKRVKNVEYLKAHLVFPSEKRKRKIEKYRYLYEESYAFHDDNGLNEQYYYVPEGFVVLDIISKEKLFELKKGLKAIYKNHMSHKFLINYKAEKDIDDMIDKLDLMVSAGQTWDRIGIFDFENIHRIRNYIDYFEIVIRNFSTSYMEIEFYVCFTDKEKNKINEFTKTNYNAKTKSVDLAYSKNAKKSGAKLNRAVASYTDNQEKSELLYDEIELCKKEFLKIMQGYLPLCLFEAGYVPMGIIISKTNIDYKEGKSDFWHSVGVDCRSGTFINKSVKIFPSYELSREDLNIQTDCVLVYNEETLESKYLDMYHNDKFQFIMDAVFNTLNEVYKMRVIDNVSYYYKRECAYFRNEINGVGARKRNYAHLLKIRYCFHSKFELMEQIKKEVNLDRIKVETEAYFENNFLTKYDRYKSYKYICAYPIMRFNEYEKNKNILEERLNQKIELSEELKQYEDSKSGWIITYINFVIGMGTFAFLLFPAWAQKIAKILCITFECLQKLLK